MYSFLYKKYLYSVKAMIYFNIIEKLYALFT